MTVASPAPVAQWPAFAVPPGDPARHAAWERLVALPLPHAGLEDWRRTDPARFPFAAARRLPDLSRRDPPVERAEDAAYDLVIAAEARGFDIRDNAGVLASGVVSVRTPAAGDGEDPAPFSSDFFAALNAAFWNFGLVIEVAAGVKLARGVLVRHTLAAPGAVFLPRVLLRLGKGAEAACVQRLEGTPADGAVMVSTLRAAVGPSARLRLVTVQALDAGHYHLSNDGIVLARDAQVEALAVHLGGGFGRARLACELAGAGARARLGGLYFAAGRQHLHLKTEQVHTAPDTFSDLLYKGAVRDEARAVYQGLIIARPGAVRTDAYQKNNNIVLHHGARADSMPGLEIQTDNLKCSHGSTVGNLDPEQIFYLRSRGMPEPLARRVLLRGFFEELLERLPADVLREEVREQWEQRMI